MRTGLAPLRRSCCTAAAGGRSRARLLLAQPVITTPVLLDDGEAAPVPQRVGGADRRQQRIDPAGKMYLLGRFSGYTATLLLIALVVIYRFSRHLTEPIRALSRAVDAIGAGQLDTRVDVRQPCA